MKKYKMTWDDITLEKFYKIQEFISAPDDWTTYNLVDLIYDVDCQNMPLSELGKFSLDFLSQPINKVKVNKIIDINGRKYNTNVDLTKVTVAQFIDYQNYSKMEQPKYEDLLSVLIWPEEAKDYNSGYDINVVKQDILQMPITVIQTLAFFFLKQIEIFTVLFLYYSKEEIMKMNLEENKKKELLEHFNNLESNLSELYHTSSNIVK